MVKPAEISTAALPDLPVAPRLKRVLGRLESGRPYTSTPVEIVHTTVMGKPVIFCVDMEQDPIQRNHRNGTFYEMRDLRVLARLFPETDGVFVDIGANVGNHSLFAALFMNAAKVIPFEPNRLCFELLIQNVLLNGLRDVIDLSRLGVGLSAAHETGFAMENRNKNIGAAKMLAGKGKLEVFPGDDLLADVTPDMIKIDVEGMELDVLSGLEDVVRRARPVMMVEVINAQEEAFFDWCKAHDMALLSTFQRYKNNKNHLVVPREQFAELESRLDITEAAQ